MKLKNKMACVACALFPASTTVAQTGLLVYAPNTSQPVPIGSTILYLCLALALSGAAYWSMRRSGNSRRVAPGFLLAGALVVAALNGGTLINEASALVSGTSSFLSSSSGGSVVIVDGDQSFTNNSGVPQRIVSITPPCPATPNTAVQACAEGQVVGTNVTCNTSYACP